MGGKTAILLGLVSGLLVGGLAIGAVITLTPRAAGTDPPASAPPSEPPASGSGAPSTTPSGSASPGSADPSAPSPAEAFGVREPGSPPGIDVAVALDTEGTARAAWRAATLPVHFWVDADGIVRDGAGSGRI